MDATLVGRRLGEFVVREELSAGGFGTVFRAEQPALARQAVIKVMHTRLRASERLIQRFLREARLASRLDHPFAAHMYAFGAEPDGVLWIAMELVRGTPLDKLLDAQGPIPLERFVPLLERICQVVQTAHDQSIIHRDLKPANVMVLARAGQLLPKLLDLGIAKIDDDDLTPTPSPHSVDVPKELAPTAEAAADASADTFEEDALAKTATPTPPVTPNPDLATSGRLTEEGAVMGSPLYMAPEQWMDAGAVDARTDIYALGVMSYELLTGKPPFSGTTRYQIAMAHASSPPPPLGKDLPPALDAVIARALAKKPQDRYGSALELAAAFRAASGLAEESVTLPRLAEDVRVAAATRAPQPIAQALIALEAARNPHQARDAVWQLVRVAVRLVAVVALAAHAHVGNRRGDARAADAVRRLRRRALPDAEWLAIARELVLPFAKLRDAHPLPELVDFFAGSAAVPIGELLALRDTADGGASDDAVRELLQQAFPLVERMLAGLAFLSDYRLVVARGGNTELWTGARRSDPAHVDLRARTLADGQPALVDASGLPVIALAPFVQAHEPARGVGPRLFFLEGTGRRGARLVALPEAFEHEDEGLWEVVGALADDTGAATSSTEACPYPGLSAFTADQATMFFGRERETEELVNRLRAQPLLAVVGPSGAGKSSFVQAGIVPSLPDDWKVVVLRPGASPMASLAARLAKHGLDIASLAARRTGTLVIVVDQFEELFTLCEQPDERQLFVGTLVQAARTVDDPVRVVITLRDDFLLHAEAMAGLRTRLGAAIHLLTTPGRDDLLRIVTEPLRRAGYEFDDPALPGEMVDALSGARSALALLSFTASKLWELRDRRFRQLSRKAYTSLGGMAGALARHAEATLDAMLPDEQRLVREVFRHAVTAEGTRAVLARDELDQLLGDDRGSAVVEKLITARLLVSSEGATGGEQIELTHEALIHAWPRLVAWRSEDAEGVRLRDQLRATARQWDERGRPSGLLWRGDALAEYRLWRARYAGALTDVETAFATASLDDATRSQRRRRALLAGSFTVLAVGVVALVVLNRQAKSSADKLHDNLLESYEAQARQYLQAGDHQRALTLLDAARKLGAHGPSHDLVAAFVAADIQGKLMTVRHEDSVFDAEFSADGTRLVTASNDKRVRVWDPATGRQIVELAHDAGVETAWFDRDGNVMTSTDDGRAFRWSTSNGQKLGEYGTRGAVPLSNVLATADGELVITVASDDAVALWDRGGKLRTQLHPGTGEANDTLTAEAALSPDGHQLAVGDHTGTLRLWDLASGALVATVQLHEGSVVAVAYSPDGTRIASAGIDHTAAIVDATTLATRLRLRHDDRVNAIAFSPDGKAIATAANDRSVFVWNTATGDRIATLVGHVAGVNAVEYSSDGTRLVTAADDGNVIVWDPTSGRPTARLVGHVGSVLGVRFDRRGERVASFSQDRTAIVWSTAPHQRATRLIGHEGHVLAGEVSPDGHTVVTAGHEDGTVRLWDRQNGRQLAIVATVKGPFGASFAPDGGQLAIAALDGVRVWDVAKQHLAVTIPDVRANDITWSADGQRLAAADDQGYARVWTTDGKPLASFHSPTAVRSVSFAPDGDHVITTGEDHTMRVWRVATGEQLDHWDSQYVNARYDRTGELLVARFSLEAMIERAGDREHREIAQLKHDGPLTDVEWSSHGDFVVTASMDATLKIWDREGHFLVALGDGHTRWWRARFSSDDRAIVGTSTNGATVWELPPPAASFDDLARCKLYELRDNQFVLAVRPADCT